MSTKVFYIELVHSLPGRTRLRLHPVPLDAPTGQLIADRLVAETGIQAVEVNRRTGSIRCEHQPEVEASRLEAIVLSLLPGAVPLAPGQRPPAPTPASHSAIARAVATAFSGINQRVLTSTGGSLDLATIAALGFAGTGAVEIAVKGNLPAPPWFNLAWWAFRTFVTFEGNGAHGTPLAKPDDD